MSLPPIVKSLGVIVKEHSPQILTALGAAGVVTTTILAVKATPAALEAIREEEAHRSIEEPNYILNNKERVQVAWKHYIPAASMGIVTIACVVSANSINLRRNAAILSAYSLTERVFTDYKEKIAQTFGPEKEFEIRQEIAREKATTQHESIVMVGTEDFLCYDSYCDRWFESTLEKIRKAENDVNRDILNEGFASLNDFYTALGLAPNLLGDNVGWRSDLPLEVEFQSKLTKEGKPALVMIFREEPNSEYYNKF